jgi:enterochelin esterase-like enzyme
MINKSFALAAILMLLIFATSVHADQQLNVVGVNHTIYSTVLKQDRKIQVFVPKLTKDKSSCDKGDCLTRYPVLYLLDGQRWFLHGVSLNNLLAEYQYIPNMIVVGITTGDSPRHRFYSDSQRIGQFIERDVLPFIEENYPVSPQKLLFGWQYAGATTLDLLASKPNLFNSYIVASPFPVIGKRLNRITRSLESWSTNKKAPQANLLFASNIDEGVVTEGTKALELLLKDKAPKSLNWKFSQLPSKQSKSAGHRLSPLDSIFLGLRQFHEYYPMLELESLAEYKRKGAMNYVNGYYSERAKRYGLGDGIPYEGLFYLAKLSLDANDPETLDLFVSHMRDEGLVSRANYSWSYRWANLLLKGGKLGNAMYVYQNLVTRFSNEAGALNGIGDVYFAKEKWKEARQHYQKAVELAVRMQDDQLEEFQADLERMSE